MKIDLRNGIPAFYAGFQSPIAVLDCGDRCAPYNEWGVPFCCDSGHVVPSAYKAEWEYLQSITDLWHLWEPEDESLYEELEKQLPFDQVLIECKGHTLCQRNFRSLACRAFPFFPYFTSRGEFIGLSYYWEYEDRCWIISNMQVVTPKYLGEFVGTFENLFASFPDEVDNFFSYSNQMRSIFQIKDRVIHILHRDEKFYKISPHNEEMQRVRIENLPKFGPYKIAALMPFPDEHE